MTTRQFIFILCAICFSFILTCIGCKSDSKTHIEKTGNPEVDAISEMLARTPNDPELYFKRAEIFYNLDQNDKAIVDLQYALSIDSINPKYYHLLSDAYLDYYNPKGAENALLQVLAIYPERIPTLLKLSELKHILEDYDGSILTLNEIIRLDPQNGEAYFMLGRNFLEMNDITRAKNAFQTAVEMDSNIPDAWMSLGELYEKEKDPKALQYYENAILINPDYMQARHAKAYFLQNNGKTQEAKKIYEEIMLLDKNYQDAYLNLGLILMDEDSLNKAKETFTILTGVAPNNFIGFYMRGIVNEKQNILENALADYQTAYNLNNTDKSVTEALAELKKKMKK